ADAQRNARIAIVDQNARPLQKAVTDIGQIAADLAQPGAVRLWRDLGDVDATRGQVDDEEHGEPRQPVTGPDVDGEEVRRGQDVVAPDVPLPSCTTSERTRPILHLTSKCNRGKLPS